MGDRQPCPEHQNLGVVLFGHRRGGHGGRDARGRLLLGAPRRIGGSARDGSRAARGVRRRFSVGADVVVLDATESVSAEVHEAAPGERPSGVRHLALDGPAPAVTHSAGCPATSGIDTGSQFAVSPDTGDLAEEFTEIESGKNDTRPDFRWWNCEKHLRDRPQRQNIELWRHAWASAWSMAL